MTYVSDPDFTLHLGDALSVLKTLPEESVDCCVTSPPYFNLRDYGIEGQFGLEPSPTEYIEKMVEIFDAVRRVLRPEGSLWLNLGDSFASKPRGSDNGWDKSGLSNPERQRKAQAASLLSTGERHRGKGEGIKEKDLIGVPWMAAFALRADGWWLRRDIIWHKPDAMPESVKDRPTSAHEYVFMLTKSKTYYYGYEESLEPYGTKPAGNKQRTYGEDVGAPGMHRGNSGRGIPWAPHNEPDPNVMTLGDLPPEAPKGPDGRRQTTWISGEGSHENHRLPEGKRRERWPGKGRNMRSVWEITTEAFAGDHFATFPRELVRKCLLAGCPEGGTVLDPFMGAGTTALVARSLGMKSVGIELNPEYASMCAERLSQQSLLVD